MLLTPETLAFNRIYGFQSSTRNAEILISLTFTHRIPLAFRGGLLLVIIVAVLHTLDRQGEFVSRTDFLWKAKLKVEQEEVETMRGINKVIRR